MIDQKLLLNFLHDLKFVLKKFGHRTDRIISLIPVFYIILLATSQGLGIPFNLLDEALGDLLLWAWQYEFQELLVADGRSIVFRHQIDQEDALFVRNLGFERIRLQSRSEENLKWALSDSN